MSKKGGTDSRTYTLTETAAIFGYATPSYRRLIRQGTAPVMPLAGLRHLRFSKALVNFIVDAHAEVSAVAEAAS